VQVVYYSIVLLGVINNNLAFPFHNLNESILIKDILSANVDYPKVLSSSLVDLFKKLFVVNPKNRYTIEQIKTHPWFVT
jgi:serine/threonine protein kinase